MNLLVSNQNNCLFVAIRESIYKFTKQYKGKFEAMYLVSQVIQVLKKLKKFKRLFFLQIQRIFDESKTSFTRCTPVFKSNCVISKVCV